MNPIAEALNSTLDSTIAGRALSSLGRRLYFPKGIIAQSAEAKQQAHSVNATIGIATGQGEPLHLPAIRKAVGGLKPSEIFPYAPTAGLARLRKAWKDQLLVKNPSLAKSAFSLPVVVNGLTHGISIIAELFVDPGDPVVVPDLFWDNYELIFADKMRAELRTYPFFLENGGLNLDGFASDLASARGGKAIVVFNFPNNPTGYSPTRGETDSLLRILQAEAEHGTRLVVFCDDAYFGLFYEEETDKESLFGRLSDLHENILAVKADAATKEELVWGFRVGFLSFAGKGLGPAQHEALVQKTMGAIRASISCANTPGQYLVLNAIEESGHDERKAEIFAELKNRYRIARKAIAEMEGPLRPLPFNSGYFMTFHSASGGAEALRQYLLLRKGIGTISFGDEYLRVAYSSVDADKLPALFAAIDEAARECCR